MSLSSSRFSRPAIFSLFLYYATSHILIFMLISFTRSFAAAATPAADAAFRCYFYFRAMTVFSSPARTLSA